MKKVTSDLNWDMAIIVLVALTAIPFGLIMDWVFVPIIVLCALAFWG